MTEAEPLPSTFDRWAASYNSEGNPFLSLERRALQSLLPPLQGLTVLDAGCGSGRHFELLSERGAGAIHGVDFSSEMLALAARDASAVVTLHCAPCDAVPLETASIDVAICSLVLGYLPSLLTFFREMRRLMRPGATLILTDIHPDTALRHKWQRSFSDSGKNQSIRWNQRRLKQIRKDAASAGLHIVWDVAFPFATPERETFSQAGHEDQFELLLQQPALFGLALRCEAAIPTLTLTEAHCAVLAHDAPVANLSIRQGRISALVPHHPVMHSPSLDLNGYIIFPGFVNTHDHLEFGLFPRLAAGPYQDAAEWADDIHKRFSATIAAHRSVPRDTRLRFGALRNLLCGVTTVCHHNPVTPFLLDPEFPVGVIDAFRWAHSPTFDQPALHREAGLGSPDTPFIVHAGEGISSRAKEELASLRELGLLRSSTVIVHALAADGVFVDECRTRNVGFIVCPSSNQNLFAVLPHRDVIERYPLAALGSDSPLTACGDLLDEARFTAQHYGLNSERLYDLLVANPLRLLGLRGNKGTLAAGSCADLIAVPSRGLPPADTLRKLDWKDIHLVIRHGEIFLLSEQLRPRVPAELLPRMTCVCVDGHRRWIRGDWSDDFARALPVSQSGRLTLGQRRIALD
jgi:cytosine/adenosine deaminase-related metal-dependent hydrolase/ubiquinone/menaquinone biosynthesis C-methylase UbiE